MVRKNYRSLSIMRLKESNCTKCKKKSKSWDNEIYKCWLKYLEGSDRDDLLKGTRFLSYSSLKYQFRKHPCYHKIASIRKRWFRKVGTTTKSSPTNYPWLLGIFYADGSIHNGTQLSFAFGTYEKIIADEVVQNLRKILSDNSHIVVERIGNMINVRTHSVELCDSLPGKKDKNEFESIWGEYSHSQKIQFIAGFIDGDGSCAFEDGINSIGIYSKIVPFLLPKFKMFLRKSGYVSLSKNKLYISPGVGKIIKEKTLKKFIKKPYVGSVDTERCWNLLKSGLSIRSIARITSFDKKTITIALRREYGSKVEKYISEHRKKF